MFQQIAQFSLYICEAFTVQKEVLHLTMAAFHHRTVIVTAGVHQGLAERLAPPGLTF